MTDAIKKGASDIHIESYEKSFRVRYRIDGLSLRSNEPSHETQGRHHFPNQDHGGSLILQSAGLPQDGRIKIKLPGGKDMDYRVSSLPTLFGEKIVLRLLDKSNLQLDMTKLGYEEQALKWFKEAIHKPFGMVLVTGPTGSGENRFLIFRSFGIE